MGIFSRLFGRKKDENAKSKKEIAQENVETFMSLISTYNQAFVVLQFGITNLKMVPEFATFKRMMKIPTTGGKLGLSEKTYIKKMMGTEYGMPETFFKEIDSSIRRNCKNVQHVQSYFFAFGNFSNDLLNHLYSENQVKLQSAMLMKKSMRSTIASLIDKTMTKTNWKSSETANAVNKLKATAATLGFSNDWMTEFVYQILKQSGKKKK